MPNWVKNIIHIQGSAEDITKALDLMRDKNVEGDIDFNNVIPMPERLNITAGGYDREYVALYLKTLSTDNRVGIAIKLSMCPVSFYGNYLKKYEESFEMADISEEKLNWMRDRLERDYKKLDLVSMEDVGKAYIDNILEYGHDTWYEWCIHNWGTKWNACECKIGDDYLEFETAWDHPFPITAELSRRFPELTFTHEWADEDIGSNCGRHEYRDGTIISEKIFETERDAYDFACKMWGYDPDELEDE